MTGRKSIESLGIIKSLKMNNLFASNYTDKDRAEMAELQLRQATEFFKLSFNFVRTLGLL